MGGRCATVRRCRYYGVNDPVAEKLLRRAAAMPRLETPEDRAITTLYVGKCATWRTRGSGFNTERLWRWVLGVEGFRSASLDRIMIFWKKGVTFIC